MEKKFDNFLFNESVDNSKYFIAKYFLKSNDMLKAAKGIAIGQSIGNPNVRLDRETSELLDNHLSIILDHPENLKNKNIMKNHGTRKLGPTEGGRSVELTSLSPSDSL